MSNEKWHVVRLGRGFSKRKRKAPRAPLGGPAANRDGKGRESVSPSGKAHNGASKTNHPKGADMRNDTTGKTRGKHYSVADLRRMFEAYERNLCRKNPRSLSQIARGLGVPDSSFRDIITRAPTCLPSRFGNKQLQRFPLDNAETRGQRRQSTPIGRAAPSGHASGRLRFRFPKARRSHQGLPGGDRPRPALLNAISRPRSQKGLSAHEAFPGLS